MKNNLHDKRNYSLIICVSILLLIGLIFISVSSISEATYTIGDKLYFVKKQLLWSCLGLFSFFIASKIKLESLKKWALPMFVVSLIPLSIILIPQFSNQTLGARRWLDLGIIGIQPSEILKFCSVIFFSKIFSQDATRNIKNLVVYLILPLILIILEPNLSTAILIAVIVITIYYTAGGEIFSLFALCSFAVIISLVLVLSSPYRIARFNSLFSLEDPGKSTSYHSNQMILALTSGHWTGKGFANSDQKYRFLPKISTDSILAVIGEETGFIGLSVIIYIYIYLADFIYKISQNTSDSFASLVAIGIGSWIAFQSLINISAVVALIPLTGVPLPFISYGGSSLITIMAAMGLIQNIQNHNLVYSNNRENKKNYHHHRHPSHTSH
jgi:cell division protein FtsW